MNSSSAARHIFSAVTIAIVASSTPALAVNDEPFEVVTAKAVYVTREGIALTARPAFAIQVQSFASMMTDARSQMLAREITLSIGPRESVMRPLRFGERPIEMRVSEPERRSMRTKISPSQAATAAGAVTALFIADPMLLAIAGGAIVLADSTAPLEEIINRQLARDERAAVPGRYAMVNKNGRVFPGAGHMVERLPDGGARDAAAYVVRHLRQPNSPSVLQGWLAKKAAQWSFERFVHPGISAMGVLAAQVQGEFVGIMVDLTVRDVTSSTSGAGDGCYATQPVAGMITSMPILCRQAWTPSLRVAAPAPLVATSAEAIPMQVRELVPEVKAWFRSGATAVQVIRASPSTFMVVPDYESSSVQLHTASPPNSLPSASTGENTAGEQKSSGGESPGVETSSSDSHYRHQSLRGLPTGVHLKGGSGGFTLDRHQ